MHTSKIIAGLLFTLIIPRQVISQSKTEYILPLPVQTELTRLDEAYTILDQFSEKVWTGWNDYLNFPFLMTFQNGLRVLIGHPAPPEGFVLYPQCKVHGSQVYIDTAKLNDYPVQLPLRCGGGVYGGYGTFNNKPVTIVDLRLTNVPKGEKGNYDSAENHILVFIHELMHCYQPRIMKNEYGNLDLNPDLNYSLYSEIEGMALAQAFEQGSVEGSLPFLRDFCIARSYKYQGMNEDELLSSRCDEFREGEAQYSEVTILQCLKNGFKSCPSVSQDPEYTRYENIGKYLDKYLKRLHDNSGKTLELYEKNYDFGCFEALLLQQNFPGWQKDIESGAWLDPVMRSRLAITASDSLRSLKRFIDIYHIEDLRNKHGKIIDQRNESYRKFTALKGQTYVISFKPIKQYLTETVDKAKTGFKLGLMEMYPKGIGTISFDGISVNMSEVPVEINQLYFVKVVDPKPKKSGKSYSIEYQSKDEKGVYINVTVTTPMFTLKAPKVEIRESGNRVKFIVLSRI